MSKITKGKEITKLPKRVISPGGHCSYIFRSCINEDAGTRCCLHAFPITYPWHPAAHFIFPSSLLSPSSLWHMFMESGPSLSDEAPFLQVLFLVQLLPPIRLEYCYYTIYNYITPSDPIMYLYIYIS